MEFFRKIFKEGRNEKDISTKETPKKQSSRISSKNENKRRKKRYQKAKKQRKSKAFCIGAPMLPKQNRLKKNKQFNYIYKHGQTKHEQSLSLSYIRTKFKPFKIGFTVSKKIGNSVVRSRVKRLLREAARQEIKNFNSNYNYIFIARESITEKNFEQIRAQIVKLLEKAG